MDASPESDPEVTLMLAAKADASGAFDQLVAGVTPHLLRFLMRQCGSPDLAEDLASETWLRAWRARHDYSPGARFRTWLYRIAVNTYLNHARSESYRTTASLETPVDAEGSPLGTLIADESLEPPSAHVERDELCAAIRAAVDQLPPKQRAAVILLRFEGQSYEEIAETLDLSVQAVKSLLNRAKTSLTASLAAVRDTGQARVPSKGARS